MKIHKKFLITSLFSSLMLLTSSSGYAKLSEDIKNQGTEHSVELSMLLKRGVPSAEIDVHASGNIIQLAGFVDNKEQFKNVSEVASKYKDKYKIINNVKILSARDDSQEESRLRDDIKRQLRDYKYPVESIDVQVRHGHVILSGFVNRNVPLKAIKSVSESVPGATVVDNYLLYKQKS